MIYEQPLNEQVRLCLRLEYLFAQADHYLTRESIWDTHQMLRTILEILQAIDRPDIKNKFYQTLNQYLQTFSHLEKLQDVDKQKLNDALQQIDLLIDSLHANQKKIGQELRENEFLNTIQQRLYTPAGTCGFSLPAYQLWLQQKSSVNKQQLLAWFKHISLLQDIINTILKLTRESANFNTTTAHGGFYQTNLDPSLSYQMIRIRIPENENLFPEISVGRYRLAIHFFTLDITGRAAQTSDDVTFELACCRI
ncbi:MAG: cell division protein ZapD [Gammaproteobacteria bacterium]|nr:cell division protein ZapD [Gammaproteobacteria bacterium]